MSVKSIENIAVTPSAYHYPLLIKQLLHTALAIAPDQEIIYADKARLTYRDFHGRLQGYARLIERLGLEGETIAVMDWDSHRYLESFFAVPMTGSVLQTVNIRLSPDQILYTLNHAKARALFVNAEFLPVLDAIRDKLETVKTFVLLSDTATAIPAGFAGEYEALLAANAGSFEFPDFDENARATTFYTTGTTGLPKGVYFSHRQLVLHTLSLLGLFGIAPRQGSLSRDDVYMPLTPMFHVHAWGFPYAATMAGLKQVYPGRYVPDTILNLIGREKVTFSHCVPTIMHMLLNSPAAANTDLKGWKVIIGGSALPTAMVKTALARGIDIFTGYGMSETCPILTIAHIETADLEGDTVALRVKTGRPNLLVDLRVVTPEMTDCPHDGKSVGEVVVRAPWNTQGYLDNPVASEALWQGGWLHTQDIGHIDERGYLQVTDRIKDVIKTGGEWVSSIEIEDVIGRHPAVAEVAVIGVKDEKWGERPLAMIVLKPDQAGKISAADIQAHVRGYAEQGHISKFGVPDQVRFVDSLARTSVGKLNKRAMREQLNQ
jgi:fatty-acyl-CoA synthase